MKSTLRLALAAMALLATPGPASAQSDDPLAEFAKPHQLVDVGDGRKLNLYCIGDAGPTVLFDSGLSDWSSIWALVQPKVAARARACSYDRAGMGYSDPGDEPRSPIVLVEDMHTLVQKAGLKTPLILVGHSLGGFNMKLYAAVYPKEVAGMVLVDPAEDRMPDRTRALYQRRLGTALAAKSELGDLSGLDGGIAHFRSCAASAAEHDLDSASKLYRSCTDPVRDALGPAIAVERARIQVGRAYQQTQASELANSVYADTRGDAAYAALFRPGVFGSKPLIVLTHSIYDRDDPVDAVGWAAWNFAHVQTAALSRRGINRIVPKTHHNIEIDDPQSIVDAVFEVIGELHRPAVKRAGRKH